MGDGDVVPYILGYLNSIYVMFSLIFFYSISFLFSLMICSIFYFFGNVMLFVCFYIFLYDLILIFTMNKIAHVSFGVPWCIIYCYDSIFEMFYDVFWIFQSINVSYYVVFCNGCIVPLRYFVVYFGLLIYYQYDVPQA